MKYSWHGYIYVMRRAYAVDYHLLSSWHLESWWSSSAWLFLKCMGWAAITACIAIAREGFPKWFQQHSHSHWRYCDLYKTRLSANVLAPYLCTCPISVYRTVSFQGPFHLCKASAEAFQPCGLSEDQLSKLQLFHPAFQADERSFDTDTIGFFIAKLIKVWTSHVSCLWLAEFS